MPSKVIISKLAIFQSSANAEWLRSFPKPKPHIKSFLLDLVQTFCTFNALKSMFIVFSSRITLKMLYSLYISTIYFVLKTVVLLLTVMYCLQTNRGPDRLATVVKT